MSAIVSMRWSVPCLIVVLAAGAALADDDKAAGIQIESPADGADVEWLEAPNGRVPAGKQALLIVEPLDGSGMYWVQPPVTTQPDGAWAADACYFGEETTSGVKFRLHVLSVPDASKWTDGQILTSLPKAPRKTHTVRRP